jgi:hypothetical protein
MVPRKKLLPFNLACFNRQRRAHQANAAKVARCFSTFVLAKK